MSALIAILGLFSLIVVAGIVYQFLNAPNSTAIVGDTTNLTENILKLPFTA